MSSLGIMTEMLSENSNPQHERHITYFYYMAQELIREMVPEMIKQEIANIDTDLWVKIQTQLNGRNIDFPEIRAYIREMIEDELRKMIKEIRL